LWDGRQRRVSSVFGYGGRTHSHGGTSPTKSSPRTLAPGLS